MRHARQTQMVFKKEHTDREILQYVVDPDAAPLTLSVKPWYLWLKLAWIGCNILATLAACVALVWLSYPSYIDNSSNTNLGQATFLNWIEFLSVLFFTADYFVRMHASDLTAWQFAKQPMNIVDFLTAAPYYLEILVASAGADPSDLFRIFFVIRTVRVVRLARYHSDMQFVVEAFRISLPMIILFFTIAVLFIAITSTAFFYAERTRFDEPTGVWMRRCPTTYQTYTASGVPIPTPNCTEQIAPCQSIPDAMYWSVTTMTTIGFGQEAPTTDLGRAIASLTIMVGLMFITAPGTVLSANYRRLQQEERNKKLSTQMDERATQAMKAQEHLRRNMERMYRLLSTNEHCSALTKEESNALQSTAATVKLEANRHLIPVADFVYTDGIVRTVFQVVKESHYVFEPLLIPKRHPTTHDVLFEDDFSSRSAERILTMHLITADDTARNLARRALEEKRIIPRGTAAHDVLVDVDPLCLINIHHDYEHAYPQLADVVYLDVLKNYQSNNTTDNDIKVRFVVLMPHLHGTEDAIALLRRTRLHVSVGIRTKMLTLHVPVKVENIMASRLVRELTAIAYERKSDHASVAYIHHSDAAMLLEGFCDQFIPTPSPNVLIVAPHAVDEQIFLALKATFPAVRLDCVPLEAANSCYRSTHLSASAAGEHTMLEINLTKMAQLDELEFGSRFFVHIPIAEEVRREAYFKL